MKYILLFTILFFSLSTQAQTLTTAKLSDTTRSLRKDMIAMQAKQAIKDLNDDVRNAKIKKMEERQDSLINAAAYMSERYYYFDSATKTYTPKPDTIIVYPTNQIPKQAIIPKSNTLVKRVSNDAENLNWQIEQLEKTVDNRDAVIDKLQKKIKTLNAQVAKLKKK